MLVSEIPYTISIYINHKIKKNHLCASAYTQKQKILVEYLGTKFLGSQYNFKVTFISNNNIEETYLITFHYWSGKFYLLNNQKNEKLFSFLGQLRAKTGLNFDLPTEAQWEYACRAGTLTALNSGHDISSVYDCMYLSQIGRYAYSERKPSDVYKQHIAVGSLAPNRWNLYDMHGNVAEICRDWNGQYQTDLQVDPHGPDNGVMHFKKKIFHLRVTRGGSWDGDNALRCRSACRSAVEDEGKNNRTGFRIVLE